MLYDPAAHPDEKLPVELLEDVVKMAREGQFKPTDNVLYLYSGGAGGLFAIDIDLG